MALAPVFAVEAAGQTSRMGWRRNAHRVGVGVEDSHFIHAPRAPRRSLDNEGSLAQPFCVQRVDFLRGLDIEMKPLSPSNLEPEHVAIVGKALVHAGGVQDWSAVRNH